MRSTLAALALLGAGWAATLWLVPWSDERVNDLFVYRSFAAPVLDGALPYRDAFLEYPPLAAPAIALPGLAGTGEDAFRAAFAGWTLVLAAAVVVLCGALAARTGGDRTRAMLAAALLPLLCGAVVRTRFDLAPVALLLGALLLLVASRPRAGIQTARTRQSRALAAMTALGLAAMTKGFPLVAAPVTLAWLAARVDRRTTLGAAAALVVALALPAAAALAMSPEGAADAVRYHLERPVQIESVPASLLIGIDAIGIGEARSVESHRSDGLEHPAAAVLTAALAVLLLAVLVSLALLSRRGPPRAVVLAALTAVAAFAALGKVLSPQYMIWLVPLGALAFAWGRHALAAAVAAAIVLTHLEFPARYFDLVAREPLPLATIGLRNAALLAVVGLALRELRREQHLLDRRGAAVLAGHQHRVQPRILGGGRKAHLREGHETL